MLVRIHIVGDSCLRSRIDNLDYFPAEAFNQRDCFFFQLLRFKLEPLLANGRIFQQRVLKAPKGPLSPQGMAQGGLCRYRMYGLDEVLHPSKSHPALDGIDFQRFSIIGNFILFLQVVEFVVNRAENDSAGI